MTRLLPLAVMVTLLVGWALYCRWDERRRERARFLALLAECDRAAAELTSAFVALGSAAQQVGDAFRRLAEAIAEDPRACGPPTVPTL